MVYRILSDGWIENVYLLKMGNKTTESLSVTLDISGIAGLRVNGITFKDPIAFTIAAGMVEQHLIRLQASESAVTQFSQPLQFQLLHNGQQMTVESRFNTPIQ